MAKRALPLLTGGLNNVARSDLIDDSQLQECINYEITGDGVLKKRTEQAQFDSVLDTKLITLFSDIISISEPYYSITDIELEQSDGYTLSTNYILLAFGRTHNNTYEVHVLYLINNSGELEWENIADYKTDQTLNELLLDAGIIYSELSDIQFVNSDDRVIITDNVNNAHYVTIDIDGFFRVGKLGLTSPRNKARVFKLTEYDDSLFEENLENSRLSQLGLFQCVYTVVSENGDESNPSPISDTLDMQFFKIDANGADERYIDKVVISDLSVPDLGINELQNLKYFKIYMRVIRYSAGREIQTLDFTERFEIINKSTASVETGNEYTLTVEIESGNTANYENDVAPICKTAAFLGGITMIGNVQSSINFPHDFKYYHPITINNKDGKHFVDAIVKINLYNETSGNNNSIKYFFKKHFISSNIGQNLQHIRIYDEDLTTPIMVCYDSSVITDEHMELYIKIPLLLSSASHIVYLCWTDEENMGDYQGVSEEYNLTVGGDFTFKGNIGIHYGRFMFLGNDGFARQQVWNNLRVKNENSLIVSDFEFSNDLLLLNKANTNINASFLDVDRTLDYRAVIPSLGENFIMGRFTYKFTNRKTSRLVYDMIYTDGLSIESSDINLTKGYASATITIDLSKLNDIALYPEGDIKSNFFVLRTASSRSVTLGIRSINNSNNIFRWAMSRNGTTDNTRNGNFFENMPEYSKDDTGIKTYNVFWSWDFNLLKSTLALYELGTSFRVGSGVFDGIKINEIDLEESRYNEIIDYREPVIKEIRFGKSQIGGDTDRDEIAENTYVDNLVFNKNEYIDDVNMIAQLWNFQPMYESPIGYNWDGTINNNIDFDETKELVYKSNRNMVKWTNVNGKAFPDLYFKKVKEPILKIMPAPSFLQFEYQNTFIIFTRNSINRFVLKGSASGWSGSSNSLIEEKQQYGLLAEKSLVRTGDALFWLSEVGVVKWDGKGFGLITKNIIDVPIKDSLFGYYVPLNNQYVLHDVIDNGISFVYHIDRNMWTQFTGLDVKKSITLTGGNRLDNINLYLKANGTGLDSYPTETFTEEESSIKTKNMFFEKGTLKRIKADYSGENKKLHSIVENVVGEEKIHIVESESEEWRGVPLGKNRGKSVTFKIENAETISSIIYELDIESEVKY